MNIEVAGVKIAFSTLPELHEVLKRKSAELDKEIEDHETKALNLRKARKEMLKVIGGKPDAAKAAAGGAAGA